MLRELHCPRLGIRVLTADERVARISLDHVRRRERLKARRNRSAKEARDLLGQRALVPAGKNTVVREAEIARDAENRRLANRLRKLRRRLERRIRLHGQDDEVDIADDILVPPAADAELSRHCLRALAIARADEDVVLGYLRKPGRERAAERAGAADDRDLHASATASSAASARARRDAASRISVFVTIGRTPSASIWCASASSTTSASISPA